MTIVLIDEVESLVSNRENGNMIEDGVRGVNAVLTGLDRLKDADGVVVICTSNVQKGERIDPAFLSRCDGVFEVGGPSGEGVKSILEETVGELRRVGVLKIEDEEALAKKMEEAGGRGEGKSGREIRKVVVRKWSEMGGGMGVKAEDVIDALWK